MFENLKQPRDITKYTLSRGATDFGNVAQFNMYESGYSFLIVVSIPRFLEILAEKYPDNYGSLITNYKHILEYEFRGLDGLENITSDVGSITNGISTLDLINKVEMQSNSTFSMRYFEKSGSVLTRTHELFLTGIKDPRTQVKHYHGLIQDKTLEAGYENEVFSFLYFVTDNTMTEIEKAYFIVSAQPTQAETAIYESEKGNIEFKEISVEFRGFPITGNEVDKKAREVLDWINNPQNPNAIVKDSTNFVYSGTDKIIAQNIQ